MTFAVLSVAKASAQSGTSAFYSLDCHICAWQSHLLLQKMLQPMKQAPHIAVVLTMWQSQEKCMSV